MLNSYISQLSKLLINKLDSKNLKFEALCLIVI